MGPSVSIELPAAGRSRLLAIARDAIDAGMVSTGAPRVDLTGLPPALLARCGAFVTLTIERRLRGCIGNLASDRALAQTVSDAAHGAAFKDHRFPPLSAEEREKTRIEISVLSPAKPMQVTDRNDLLHQLVPGIDGLVLTDGSHRATFLPKVWEQLATPEMFLEHLLLKAGLPPKHWSRTLRFERYGTTSFGESTGSVPGQCH
jgi:AmmeMemoRadiSam system protein A